MKQKNLYKSSCVIATIALVISLAKALGII